MVPQMEDLEAGSGVEAEGFFFGHQGGGGSFSWTLKAMAVLPFLI